MKILKLEKSEQKKVRKQIDIPNDIKIELQILAAKADKDLKNYIQDLLIDHANNKGRKVKNSWMKEND